VTRVPEFDLQAAHRHFAAHCFNAAWDLMEKLDRTPEEDRAMVASSYASLYHWLQRSDGTPQQLSVGYWQLARIAALLGHADEARRHGEACRTYADGLAPFFQGYAHEALARAARVAGDGSTADAQLALARRHAAQVEDAAERALLERDLADLER